MERRYAIVLFIVVVMYFLIMTIGVPFFLMDYINISIVETGWKYEKLSVGQEFYFRPLENALYFGSYALVGNTPLLLRVVKAFAAGGVMILIYYFIQETTKENKIAFLGSLVYASLSAVLMSITLVYDSEILCNLFLLLATYFFLKSYHDEKPSVIHTTLFIIFNYCAILIKESGKLFVGIVLLFIIVTNRGKLKKYLLALVILLIISTYPGTFLDLKNPQADIIFGYIMEWFSIINIIYFLKYFIISCFFILLLILIINIKKPQIWKEVIKNNTFIFFAIWFFYTLFLTLGIPMVDSRYATVPLSPFIVCTFIFMGMFYASEKENMKKLLKYLFIFFILFTLMLNLGLSLKTRYGYVNFFIGLNDAYTYVEETYVNKAVVIFGTSTYFLNAHKTKNTYQSSAQNISENAGIFISDGTQKFKGDFIFTNQFKTGPYCFSVYTKSNTTSRLYEMEQKEGFMYDFSEKVDSCSIEIETQFYLPGNLIIEFKTDNQIARTTITPPLGKQSICEYSCAYKNITQIHIFEENSLFNKIINKINSANVRIIK